VKLTERQLDHLRILAMGGPHRPIKGCTHASVYMMLERKGLAKSEQFQVLRWAITPAGRRILSGKNNEAKA